MHYAICNETFEGWDHAEVCKQVADLGYQGLEIAPYTLAPRITDVSASKRNLLRTAAEACGLKIIGLHWLLAKTEGLQLTSPDQAVRQRTADYLLELARCTRDLGGDLMVFGSPAQRRIPTGHTKEQATAFAVDTFRRTASAFVDFNVKLCLEPLSPPEADFINTIAEAVAILQQLNHSHFALHLDVKAMSTDDAPTPDLVRRYGKQAGHFHANDANRRGPGFGATDFVPIFRALHDSGYGGWVSVEVFDYAPDPVTIARESIRYMKECAARAKKT
ncbi:MAG: sugar phosphate isomerase/epimerase [Gemmataceae bacterium]|nr:sugar phosphate isomerase/epimerase [Gemmataceae bacterium]